MKRLRLVLVYFLVHTGIGVYAQQIEQLDISSFLGNIISPLLIYHSSTFNFLEPFTILGYQKREEFERRIIFLEDDNNQKFILKCYGDDQKEEAVCEYLGAFIGSSAHVPINKIKIVLGGSLFVGLNNGTSLATLHTHVPGKELCKWYEAAPNDIILKGGLISQRHLQCLTLSDDLCDIIALDIFLNNADRHHENCFFDVETGHYYAIDMGDIFLAARKCENIEGVVSDEVSQMQSNLIIQEKIVALDSYQFLDSLNVAALSKEQTKALCRVSDTLRKLLLLYPAETMLNMWLPIAHEVGYVYTDYKKNYLALLLQKNMYWVHKLIEKIDESVAI
jgi:hypothetical protein